MNLQKEQELQIETYLRTLRESLPGMSVAEREEIVREISVHIRESAEALPNNLSVILQRLGPAKELAAQYGHDQMVRQASRSISPLLILRATRELARRGAEGSVLFVGALFGYSLGIGFLIVALVKPFLPRQTGLWIGPGVFDFGVHEPRYGDSVHELLGWWIIPVALWLGCLFVWLTTICVRKFLRRTKNRGPVFARNTMSAATNL